MWSKWFCPTTESSSGREGEELVCRKMIKNLKQMPDIRGALMRGVTQGFNTLQDEKAKEFTGRNPEASNFLRAFLGTGALKFQDDTGSVNIDPRTGAFSGTPGNPEGFGFSINPLTQSASIRKGPFELSGGLRDAPIPTAPGYGPINDQLFNFGRTQENAPWGRIGFSVGGQQPAQGIPTEEKSPTTWVDSRPRTNLYTQPPERKFADQSVKELYERTMNQLNSGRDPYNPATW